jgi:hypothetical protein
MSSLAAVTHTSPENNTKVRENNPKARVVEEDAGKAKARIKERAAHSLMTITLSSPLSAHACMNAKRTPSKSTTYQKATTPWTPILARNLHTDLNLPPRIERSCVYTAQTPPILLIPATQTPILSFTTIARTTALTSAITGVTVV